MRRGLLALCCMATMVLAGCVGPSSATWGDGSGVEVISSTNENGTQYTVKTGLSGSSTTHTVESVGCDVADGGALVEGSGEPFTFTGYLAASTFYQNHNSAMGARDLDFGVTTAVAIQSMSFSEAAGTTDGNGARIDVKEWTMPLSPETGAGSVDLDEVDRDSDSRWFVLGLIPSTEHILDGMMALGEWHQPVSIQGYMVDSIGEGQNNPNGYSKQWHAARSDCSMTVGDTNREDLYVIVTGLTLEGATVSATGEADDEWVQGDVPILGRSGFIMLFLVGGVGGSVGAFILSKGMVMRAASNDMKTLIGSEGMKKAASVKTDAKAAKKAGMESPSERQARLDKEQAKERKQESASTPPPNPNAKDDNPMGGFDLDSVLASSVPTSPRGGGPSQRKSSVVATEAAQSMDRMNEAPSTSASSLPPSMSRRSSSPPTGRASSPPSAAPVSNSPPIRRRKSVKKEEDTASSQPEEPAQQPTTYEDEEEFSDFSF